MGGHREAFCLMWYACECGHRERIWNSRDGVTPFGGILCTSCGGKGMKGGMRHVDWHLDESAPGHAMAIGQRFFRDGTRGDAITIIKDRINKFRAAGNPIPDDIAESLLDDARNDRDDWKPGWPMVDRWDAAKANAAKKAA